MKLTEDEMLERRKTILLTAFRLFCKRGIDHVSLIEIAKKAGVGESTLYRYFDNKTALVLESFLKVWDSIMIEVAQWAVESRDYQSLSGYDQISVWLDAFRLLYRNYSNFILFSYEAKLYLLRCRVSLSHFQQDTLLHAIRGPCLAALEKGKKDGTIPLEESSCEDVFYAMWGSVRGYLVKIVIYDQLYGDDNPWELRYRTMQAGILSALSSGWK